MKNNLLKSLWTKVFFPAALLVSLGSVLSCDIGLGEAVDVSAPTLTISYPPSGAVIRDSFVLAGECKDDVMINSVNVRVVSTNSGKEVYSGMATVTGTSWKITLNNFNESAYKATNGWQYADGTYEITAWATDNSGKTSGVSARSVDVDNTAPVFIIQSPGVTKKNVVVDGATPTAYGTVFTVSGTIVDLHDIGKFTMNFYDDTGAEIPGSTFIESTVPTAGGTEVTIATYVKDSTENQYYKLYKDFASENSVSKKFFCSLALEDEAKVYKTPNGSRDAAATVGNATSSVYLYDDVYTEFLSKKTENADIPGGLSAQNFMSVLNGTYGSSNLLKIRGKILEQKRDTTASDDMLAFSLNPNADPKYIVNGFELVTSGNEIGTSTEEGSSSKISQAGNNNTLNISISAGLDGVAIAPWSVHVFMYDFGNNTSAYTVNEVQKVVNKFRAVTSVAHKSTENGGFVTKSSKNIITESDNPEYIKYFEKEIPGIEYVGDNIKSGASSSKQATVSVNLPRTIATGHYYIILVSGYDVDCTSFAQTDLFGFVGMATGERPKIAVSSPKDLSYAKQSDEIVFEGTATKGDVLVKEVTAYVTVTNEENGEYVASTNTNPLTYTKSWADDDEEAERTWKINLKDMTGYANAKADLESGKSYLYSAKFIATDKSENTADTTRSVHVDAVEPEVEITSITPIVEGADYDGSTENYVNGNITVKANITETNLNEVVFQVFVDGVEKPSLKKTYSKENKNLKYTLVEKINTKAAEIPDNKDIEIRITARDTVGNETVCSSKGYNSSDASKNLMINQETDKPVFKFMNFADHNAYATEAQAAAGKFYVSVDKAKANSSVEADKVICPEGQTPVKNKLADESDPENKIYEYLIIKENSNLFSSSNKTMLFSVTDDDQIKEVTVNCYKAKADGTVDNTQKAKAEEKKTVDSATYSGNYTVPESDGIYYVQISASDKEEGKETSVVGKTDLIKIVVSSNAPEISFTDSGSTYYDVGNQVTVTGSVSSWDGFAKLDKGAYDADGAKTGAFTDTLYAVEPAAGSSENEVFYTATNSYGQSSTAKYKYNIDVEDPTVNISSITPVVIRKAEGDVNEYCVNGVITITGNANDNSDIDYIEYAVYKAKADGKIDKTKTIASGKKYKVPNESKGKKNTGSFSSTSTVNSWDFSVDTTLITKQDSDLNKNPGKIFIIVTANDVAGNAKEITSGDFLKEQTESEAEYIADQSTDRPVVSPNNFVILENNEKDIKRGTGGNLFNNTDNNTLMVSVSDDDGVKKVECYYKKATDYSADGSATFPDAWTKFNGSLLDNGSSTSINLTQELLADEGKYMIKFVVIDTKYVTDGQTPFNKYETAPYYIGVSEGKPVISLEAPENNGYTRSYDAALETKPKLAVKGTASNASGKWTSLLSVERTVGSDYRDATPVADAPDADKFSRTGTSFTDAIYPVAGSSGTKQALTYTVKDVFGDSNSATVNYILDNTAPVFAVPKNGHTSFKLKVQGTDYNSEKLVWYKVSDISIEGHFFDDHSGISNVHYELTPNGSATVTDSGTIAATKETSNPGYYKFKGTISGIVAGKNNKLVLYAIDECGNTSAKEVITIQMDETAPDFKANWVTVDSGMTHNEANGSVTVNGRQSVVLYGQLSDALSGVGKLTSGNAIDFIVNGKKIGTTTYTTYAPDSEHATDTLDKWEVASATEYKDYAQITDKTAITGWKTIITAAELTTDGPLSVDCIDRANTKFHNSSVLNFIVDSHAPVVKVRTNSVNVNGTSESIEGTVTENISLEGMEIFYRKGDLPTTNAKVIYDDPALSPADYGWTKIESFGTVTDVSKIYSWTLENFNFNEASGADNAADGKGTVWILPSVKDKAGNSSVYTNNGTTKFPWNATKFTVDMNSDRPVVQVSNLNRKGNAAPYTYLLQFGTDAQIKGKISDDDAESEKAVKVFVGCEKAIKSIDVPAASDPVNETEYTVTFTDGSTENIKYTIDGTTSTWERTTDDGTETSELKGSDWTYTPANKADGNKKVFFYVVDNKGGVFYTGYKDSNNNAKTLYMPKFQSGSNEIEDSVTELSYDSDCTSPKLNSTNVISYSTKTEYSDADKSKHTEPVNTSLFVGGKSKKYIKFELTGYDANKIDGFTLEATGKGTDKSIKYFVGNVPSTTDFKKDTKGSFDENKEISVWTTDFIDISTWPSCEVDVTVSVYDKTGLPANGNSTFNIDNSAPLIKNVSPRSTDQKTGTFAVEGITDDTVNSRLGSGVASTTYYVPKKTEVSKTDAELAILVDAEEKSVWQNKSPDKENWQFAFNGNDGTYDCPKFETFAKNAYGTSDGQDVWTIPVYIKAEDELGNVAITRHSIWYNPEGDKPMTEITYPSEEQRQEGKDYAVLGGAIRVTGTVTIPNIDSGAFSEQVFIQIAPESFDSNGVHNEAWDDTATKKKCTDAVNIVNGENKGGYGYSKAVDADGAKITAGFSSDANKAKWWGIPVDSSTSSSWVITLNSKNELNPKDGSQTTNNIAIRACSVNNEGKVGAWSAPYYIHIDNNAPTMVVKLRQYAANVEENADSLHSASYEVEKDYEPSMYLKGKWYIYLDICDETGIKNAEVIGKTTSEYVTRKYIDAAGNDAYEMWVPVIGSDGRLLAYQIYAEDNDTGNVHKVTNTYQFYLDNTAPVMGDILDSSETALTNGYKIQDRNSMFSLSNIVTEGESGYERTVFYFIRKSAQAKVSGKEQIFDPCSLDGSKKKIDVGVNTDGLKPIPVVLDSNGQDKSTHYLYGLSVAGKKKKGEANNFYPNSSIAGNTHIRVGGLIKIDGVFRKITKITSTYVEFDEATDGKDENVTAEFVYAHVVDNRNNEGAKVDASSMDGFTFTKDDGDNLSEKMESNTSGGSWSASVRSTNIPDGPVTLVVMTFDKAGNVDCREITASVGNNAPRIAKVFLGTDINGDSKYQSNEFVEYNWSIDNRGDLYKDGYTDAKALKTADYVGGSKSEGNGRSFIIKNGLAVVPEVVGGNFTDKEVGPSMVYSKTAEGCSGSGDSAVIKAGVSKKADRSDVLVKTAMEYTLPSSVLSETGNKFYGFTLTRNDVSVDDTSDDGDGYKESEKKPMSFTFYDNTEEGTLGVDTQHAVLYVEDFIVDQVDDRKPVAKIHPFHWNSREDNSLQKDSDGNLLGHIELEDDLPSAFTTSGTGVNDRNPKVSGKIVLTGYAYDETRLSKIQVYGTANKFNPTDCFVEYKDVGGTVKWTVAENAVEGWKLTVNPDSDKEYSEPTQTGHLVEWKLEVDTEKGAAIACEDLVFTVTATDATVKETKNTSTAGSTATTRNTVYATNSQYTNGKFYETAALASANAAGTEIANASVDKYYEKGAADSTYTNVYAYHYGSSGKYQMDVVPYVTNVETGLYSNLKSSIRGAYYRSSKGHYIVKSDETVVLNGFNLTGMKYDTETTALTSVQKDGVVVGVSMPMSKMTQSGKPVLKVNGISIFNNMNNNNAKGSYTGTVADETSYTVKNNYAYNRQANQTSNNLLTDDVEFDIWQFNSNAAKPNSGKLSEPIMAINPVNKKIGFAFVSGPAHFAMGGKNGSSGTDYSYQLWQMNYATFNNISFAYDSLGNTYGTATGLDTYPRSDTDTEGGRFTFNSSNWGHETLGTGNNYSGTKKVRLESIGIPKGKYIEVGNTKYDLLVKGNIPETYSLTETRFSSPSLATAVHGTGTKTTAVYLAYYDDIHEQIRFRYCSNVANRNTDNFMDNNGYGFITGDGSRGSNVMEAKTSDFSLIAGIDYQQNYNTTTPANGGYNTGYTADKYVSIGVIPGTQASKDIVVAVWYDGRNCRYAYNDNPTSGKDNGSAGGWNGNKVIFTEGGEYCSLAIDKNGGIHIAANVDGCLKYAYLSGYAASYTEATDSVVVDSYTDAGEHIGIDVGFKEFEKADKTKVSVAVPHISYISNKKFPAVAILDSFDKTTGVMDYRASGTHKDGSAEDVFTGKWNVSVVPTVNKLSDGNADKINVGLWKSAGVITTSQTGTNSSGQSEGNCWGNGTANAVLGYAIKSGSGSCIETAQMK